MKLSACALRAHRRTDDPPATSTRAVPLRRPVEFGLRSSVGVMNTPRRWPPRLEGGVECGYRQSRVERGPNRVADHFAREHVEHHGEKDERALQGAPTGTKIARRREVGRHVAADARQRGVQRIERDHHMSLAAAERGEAKHGQGRLQGVQIEPTQRQVVGQIARRRMKASLRDARAPRHKDRVAALTHRTANAVDRAQ